MKSLVKTDSDIVTEAIDVTVMPNEHEISRFDSYPAIKVVVRADRDQSKVSVISGSSGEHESLKHILHLILKVMMNSFSLTLIMLLIIAWLVSDPILRALDRRTHKTKQKAEKQNLKARLLTNRMRCRNLMAIISASTTIWLKTGEAQLTAVPIESATGEVHTFETSNTSIWLNGI
jgi:hypothetical protein